MVYFAPQAKNLEHTDVQSGIFCAAGENFRDKEIPNLMNSWVPTI